MVTFGDFFTKKFLFFDELIFPGNREFEDRISF